MAIKDAWTTEQIATAIEMRSRGCEYADIGLAVKRTAKAVQGKMYELAQSPGHRDIRNESRRLNRQIATRFYNAADPSKDVPAEVLERQAAYLNAPKRDLSGLQFGDPPVGFSALDRRAAR